MATISTARRLLKLHAASTRAVSSQARALCVGPSRVVFRVALQHVLSDAAWVTAVSEAACRRVFSAARHLLRDRSVARTLRCHVRGALHQAATLAATAFTSQGIASTTRRQRSQRVVEAFVADCWAALSLLLLLRDSRESDRDLRALLCELLAVPRSVLSSHDANARAVCAIESATTTAATRHSECCVCLDALAQGQSEAVRLPCRHELHEDCALAWLARKRNCPHCRADLLPSASGHRDSN